MAKFTYKAKDNKSETVAGKIDAKDEESAINILQGEKLYVIEINKLTEFKLFNNLFKKIPLKEKIMFTTQIAVMIKSSLPILEAVTTVQNQTQNKRMKEILKEMAKDISSGLSFSKALAKHPDVFSETYTKIVESGEKSGRLDQVMLKLSRDLEKDYDLTGKIRSALMYPVFILIVLFIVMAVVLVYVMPQLKGIFKDVGATLPLPTRMVLGTSDLVVNYWYIFILAVVALIFFGRRYLSTKEGNYAFDKFKLKIPILKDVIINIYMSRFARSLSSLVSAGIPMLDVLETTKGVMGSALFEREIDKIIIEVKAGSSISKAMKKSTYFPPVVTQLMAVGEKSGKTDYILKNLSRFLEKEVDATVRNLTALMEPVMIVILGAGVAVVIISVIMPIYGLVSVIQ